MLVQFHGLGSSDPNSGEFIDTSALLTTPGANSTIGTIIQDANVFGISGKDLLLISFIGLFIWNRTGDAKKRYSVASERKQKIREEIRRKEKELAGVGWFSGGEKSKSTARA